MTAIATVPLLLIKMKVIMAIRMRGMFSPPMCKAKISLGLGHGTVVVRGPISDDALQAFGAREGFCRMSHRRLGHVR